ncbi:hypothetical protein [Bradyrhizobium sp. BWA-3-5]|uniref:hypothetical protein n=1 Tax=Bradyrhizobium sp. BWA-3-5 TaxID=3080013 RepID=UPI00293E7589|nr:hypothetical protein [Bradyrhizobium sp. BWA-3-5]WOH70079.1 hypothetical protein RX331_24805 [Bradyrhizobium sp. BWA-3-5]
MAARRIKHGNFTWAGSSPTITECGLKVGYRGMELVQPEKLSFKKQRGGWRTRPSPGCGGEASGRNIKIASKLSRCS